MRDIFVGALNDEKEEGNVACDRDEMEMSMIPARSLERRSTRDQRDLVQACSPDHAPSCSLAAANTIKPRFILSHLTARKAASICTFAPGYIHN